MSDPYLQEGLEAYADAIATLVAVRVVKALQANAPFTAEDIERIKDHVHPKGVAFKNGFKAGKEACLRVVREWCAPELAVPIINEIEEETPP